MNEFENDLQRVLIVMRPVVEWSIALRAAGLDGPEVWRQEDPDLWPMSGPQEEYALPPLVLWSEDLRLLAKRAYQATYDRFLEPGESYQFTWPPRGALWDPGSWRHDFADDDMDGETDADPACAIEYVDVIIEPASWMWHLPVERVGGSRIDDEQPWLMGRTEVDPRTVEYSVFGGDDAHAYVEVLQTVVERAAHGG